MTTGQEYLCAFAISGVVIIAFFIEEKMYQRKERPKKTNVLCPKTDKPLKDFELFNGHCVSCKFHAICKEKIKTNEQGKRI